MANLSWLRLPSCTTLVFLVPTGSIASRCLATCLVFRQQLRSARLKANLTAEVAEEEDEAEELLVAKNQSLLEAKESIARIQEAGLTIQKTAVNC